MQKWYRVDSADYKLILAGTKSCVLGNYAEISNISTYLQRICRLGSEFVNTCALIM